MSAGEAEQVAAPLVPPPLERVFDQASVESAVQENDLEQIGIRVEITCTAAHNTLRADPGAWDVYASAMVTAPTGDPAYFFSSCCLDDSPANNGGYHSDQLEALARQLDATFDPVQRGELAGQMQQILLDDDAYVFCSHLQMNLIARAGVTGLTAHPCDYYEITAELDVE